MHLCNDLEIVTASEYPVITSIKEQLLIRGAMGALMSGSGSAVFGLFSDSHTAERAKQTIDENTRWDAFVCHISDGSHLGGK
jgi:4-diphosphocytidyl-2-C-methyl-D-erythritol kinase